MISRVQRHQVRGRASTTNALDDYVTMPGEVTLLRHNADRLFKVDVGGDDYSGVCFASGLGRNTADWQ